MGEDRERNHRGSNGETGWNRVMFNVVNEAVLDAGGVFLESENKAWETDATEANQSHFDRDKWVFER